MQTLRLSESAALQAIPLRTSSRHHTPMTAVKPRSRVVMAMRTWVVSLVITTALFGHDSYLIPAQFRVQPGSSLLISVHNGDSFPSSEHPTDPARIAYLRLSDGSAVTGLRMMGRATYGVTQVSSRGSLYVSSCLHPRSHEIPGSTFEAYLQEEGLQDAIRSRQQNRTTRTPGREIYTKCTKAYIVSAAPDKGYAVELGHPIEFVPEEDPALLTSGSFLPVRVLFGGKPLANVQVQMAWDGGEAPGHVVAGRTAADGRIRIPITVPGKWRLHTVHMQPADHGTRADWKSYWASFTFEAVAGQ